MHEKTPFPREHSTVLSPLKRSKAGPQSPEHILWLCPLFTEAKTGPQSPQHILWLCPHFTEAKRDPSPHNTFYGYVPSWQKQNGTPVPTAHSTVKSPLQRSQNSAVAPQSSAAVGRHGGPSDSFCDPFVQMTRHLTKTVWGSTALTTCVRWWNPSRLSPTPWSSRSMRRTTPSTTRWGSTPPVTSPSRASSTPTRVSMKKGWVCCVCGGGGGDGGGMCVCERERVCVYMCVTMLFACICHVCVCIHAYCIIYVWKIAWVVSHSKLLYLKAEASGHDFAILKKEEKKRMDWLAESVKVLNLKKRKEKNSQHHHTITFQPHTWLVSPDCWRVERSQCRGLCQQPRLLYQEPTVPGQTGQQLHWQPPHDWTARAQVSPATQNPTGPKWCAVN